MYDYNKIANRFMSVDFDDFVSVLSKFLAYLESVEIIYDYIKDCGEPTINIEDEVKQVTYGQYTFMIGETDTEEVTNIYHLLKHIAYITSNNNTMVASIVVAYSHSRKFQDKVQAFNKGVSMVLIGHIESYLTKIGIDIGMDENTTYSITVNNGQVNLATDNAMIKAVQNNRVDVDHLKALLEAVRKEIGDNLSLEDTDTANESLEAIESELSQTIPKRSLLKTAIKGLTTLKSTAEFGAAVAALAEFISNAKY